MNNDDPDASEMLGVDGGTGVHENSGQFFGKEEVECLIFIGKS